ncbi:MAG: hypothetical protein ACKVWR_06195 [Acidimicrobiales bacterium]
MGDEAQLSSVSASLDELARRVSGVADGYAGDESTESLAGELYEVERALRSAIRRLDRLVRDLR